MDIITIFQELPDIKTISIGKEYLVVDKNDRPKISKKGKINPKKIRKVQHVKVVRESLTTYGLDFIPQFRNEFRLDLFNDPMLILKTDFWNTFQVIEELDDNFEKKPNNIIDEYKAVQQLIDEQTAKTTVDKLFAEEKEKKGKKTRTTTNQNDAE